MRKLILLILLLSLIAPVSADTFLIYTDTAIGRYTIDVFFINNTFIETLRSNQNVTIPENNSFVITVRQSRFDAFQDPGLFFDWIIDNGLSLVQLGLLAGFIGLIIKLAFNMLSK